METKIIYELKESDLSKVISEKLSKLVESSALSRYKGRLIGVKAVCELHGIHRDTVIGYAQAHAIPHIREGKQYMFDAFDALQFDFTQLRKTKNNAL